jgi:hypothetical protein
MSGPTSSPRSTLERAASVQRLKAAVSARRQAREERESTKGTSAEIRAAASLQAANDEVSARRRWLTWVVDGDDRR